jgi:glycosyltransferase involved in cell wall biosynthesis
LQKDNRDGVTELDRIVHPASRDMAPRVSVVVAAFNRAEPLRRLIESLLDQEAVASFEIIVADNASTDATPDVARSFGGRGIPVRYVREARPGVSYARNAGAAAAAAPILAFTDDDQHVAPTWVSTLLRVLEEHPDIDAVGGRVLARWEHPPPAWITARVFGPVSLFDRGERPFRLHRRQWMCLPGGNLAIRRTAFEALGGFDPRYPRSQDRELTVRLLLSGRAALYVPEMVVYHHLDAGRLTKERFRRWNECEGRMRAGYAFEELFTRSGEIRELPADIPRVFGVSRFMYRRLSGAAASYVLALLVAPGAEAFRRELRVRYLWAYMRRRRELARADAPDRSVLARAWNGAVNVGARMVAFFLEIGP